MACFLRPIVFAPAHQRREGQQDLPLSVTVEATCRGIHRRTNGQRIVRGNLSGSATSAASISAGISNPVAASRRSTASHHRPTLCSNRERRRVARKIRLDIDSPQGAKLILRPEAVKQVPAGQLHRLFDR